MAPAGREGGRNNSKITEETSDDDDDDDDSLSKVSSSPRNHYLRRGAGWKGSTFLQSGANAVPCR